MSDRNRTVTLGDPKSRTARRAMVDNQIRTYDVTDQRLLEAFYIVPREAFLPPALADLAYSDATLAVDGSGGVKRVLLVPMVLARMIQGAVVQPTDKVLVIASGTGYAAAILAGLVDKVVALESDESFSAGLRDVAGALGFTNVETVTGSLPNGRAEGGPYDVILICGAVEERLETIESQLAPRGRLIAIQTVSPEATRRAGKATLYERTGSDMSARVLFDAGTPVLEEFRRTPAFVF